MIILLMFGAYALFIGGAQVLQLVYPNEIFPTEIRTGAVGIGTSMSRIGAASAPIWYPFHCKPSALVPLCISRQALRLSA
ncbi:hypothetical protein [Pantoea rodasii]|uniref:hypothetical protein n=1 Tax=Pantoea rodasii TaxID=1076549 RepID=UPI003F511872